MDGSVTTSLVCCLLVLESLVLFTDLVELLHVLVEVGAALECDEELGLLAVALVAINGDGLRLDPVESRVVVAHEVLGGDNADGDCVAEGVHLNGLVGLEVFLPKEHVEVRVFLRGHVDLVRVNWGPRGRRLLLLLFHLNQLYKAA